MRLIFASGPEFTLDLERRENSLILVEISRKDGEEKSVQVECKNLQLEIEDPERAKRQVNKVDVLP
jgi:hypothetical protein